VTSPTDSVTCDVVICHRAAVGRYLHVRQHGALEFRVCTVHFDRLEGGETPDVVTEQRWDVARTDTRPGLIMNPV
jgi:hypothetical protein